MNYLLMYMTASSNQDVISTEEGNMSVGESLYRKIKTLAM